MPDRNMIASECIELYICLKQLIMLRLSHKNLQSKCKCIKYKRCDSIKKPVVFSVTSMCWLFLQNQRRYSCKKYLLWWPSVNKCIDGELTFIELLRNHLHLLIMAFDSIFRKRVLDSMEISSVIFIMLVWWIRFLWQGNFGSVL